MALAEPADGPTAATLTEHARRLDCWFCGGFPEKDGAHLYNSAFLVGPSGLMMVYRKIHLFDREKEIFDPGNLGFPVFKLTTASAKEDVTVGIMICYDWFFPEAARSLALQGAQVILHPANLVLPHCPAAMPIRCLENHVFAVTANRVGREKRTREELQFIGTSQLIGTDGAVLMHANRTDEMVRAVSIKPERALQKTLGRNNDLFGDRRPDTYKLT